jgi:DNA-binding CsgD family transcriptional regulator
MTFVRPRSGTEPTIVFMTAEQHRVLRHLSNALTFPEIADALGEPRHVVRTHAAAVYRALGVSSRDAAVDSARRLGLLVDLARAAPRDPRSALVDRDRQPRRDPRNDQS